MKNGLSIDVEEYFHALNLRPAFPEERWADLLWRAEVGVDQCLQILDQAQQKATFFVLGWVAEHQPELVRRIAAEGHEIGSHSMSHPLLPQLEGEALRHEVAGSRRLLQERLETSVDSFCYPNGDQDRGVVETVRRAGYKIAVTTRGGTNHREIDPLLLKRFDMRLEYVTDSRGTPSLPLLLFRLSGLHPAA